MTQAEIRLDPDVEKRALEALQFSEILSLWQSQDFGRAVTLLPSLSLISEEFLMAGVKLHAKIRWRSSLAALDRFTAQGGEPVTLLSLVSSTVSYGQTAIEQLPESVRKSLESSLEAHVQACVAALPENLGRKLRAHYRIERDSLQWLRNISGPIDLPKKFLLSPEVARAAKKNHEILEWLWPLRPVSEPGSPLDDNSEDVGDIKDDWEVFLEKAALYSPIGGALERLIANFSEEGLRMAFQESSGSARNSEPWNVTTGYVQNKARFQAGLSRIVAGDSRGKKYLAEITLFFKEFPRYAKQIAQSAYSAQTPEAMSLFAEVLESLAATLPRGELRKAAAYAISMKVRDLLNRGVMNESKSRQMMETAMTLDPDCTAGKAVIGYAEEDHVRSKIVKFLGKAQFHSAVDLVLKAEDREFKEFYFDMVAQYLDSIEGSGFLGDPGLAYRLSILETESFRLSRHHKIFQRIQKLQAMEKEHAR